MRAIGAEAQLESAGASRGTSAGRRARWTAWRLSVAGLVVSIYAAEEARAQQERRHLDRMPTPFPDLRADWQRLHDDVVRLASLGDAVSVAPATADGDRRRGRASIDLARHRAAALDRAPEESASVVDAARAACLDFLGDTAGAATMGARRTRLLRAAAPAFSASRISSIGLSPPDRIRAGIIAGGLVRSGRRGVSDLARAPRVRRTDVGPPRARAAGRTQGDRTSNAATLASRGATTAPRRST
jgi:hypothetical protein